MVELGHNSFAGLVKYTATNECLMYLITVCLYNVFNKHMSLQKRIPRLQFIQMDGNFYENTVVTPNTSMHFKRRCQSQSNMLEIIVLNHYVIDL